MTDSLNEIVAEHRMRVDALKNHTQAISAPLRQKLFDYLVQISGNYPELTRVHWWQGEQYNDGDSTYFAVHDVLYDTVDEKQIYPSYRVAPDTLEFHIKEFGTILHSLDEDLVRLMFNDSKVEYIKGAAEFQITEYYG